jgi:hypothetical protein
MTLKMQDFEAWQIIMNERKEIRRIKRLDQGLFDLLGDSIIYIMQYSERCHIPFLTEIF